MSSSEEIVIDPSAIKELQFIEDALSDVDIELTAKQHLMTQGILAHRQNTIAKIPGFWGVVFDHASTELEAAITSDDLTVLAQALKGLEVTRPEIPPSAAVTDSGLDKFGEPRSVTIRFHFSENEWFTDSVLEKTFYYRYGKDGSAGLVSEPVRVNWKPGKDLTEGLTDAAYKLWLAQKQIPSQQLDGVLTGDARKARDEAAKQIPEYKNLVQLLDTKVNGAISFFNFFSYRGRWTSAAESLEAKAEVTAKRQAALLKGNAVEEDDDDDEEDFPEEDVETFPAGHEVANSIAEDIWPTATEYFLADVIDSDDELDGIEIDDSDNEDGDEDVEMS